MELVGPFAEERMADETGGEEQVALEVLVVSRCRGKQHVSIDL